MSLTANYVCNNAMKQGKEPDCIHYSGLSKFKSLMSRIGAHIYVDNNNTEIYLALKLHIKFN